MRRIGVLMLAVAAVSAQSAVASSISYLGVDTVTNKDYRSPGVAKTAVPGADVNGDNVYGSDGYFVNGGWNGLAGFDCAAPKSVLPSYVSGVALATGVAQYAFASYTDINDPSQPAVGGLVANFAQGGNFAVDPATPKETPHDFFKVTLAADKTFVQGIIFATANYSTTPTTITITSSTGATLTQTIPAFNANPEYAFFTLSGVAGETFTTTLAVPANGNYSASSGITFEAVPEPTSLGLLGLGSLALLRRRRA